MSDRLATEADAAGVPVDPAPEALRPLPAGRIEVLPPAIAALAARAAAATPGIVGLVLPAANGVTARPLQHAEAGRGVVVRVHNNQVSAEVFVLVEYGAPIAEVAAAAQERVRAALEHALGEQPAAVTMRVQGVRGRAHVT